MPDVYDSTGPALPCLICGDPLYDDEVNRHMQEHRDEAPDIMADALRKIREYAKERAAADPGLAWTVEVCNAALRRTGAE
jgi:hypothetical protein